MAPRQLSDRAASRIGVRGQAPTRCGTWKRVAQGTETDGPGSVVASPSASPLAETAWSKPIGRAPRDQPDLHFRQASKYAFGHSATARSQQSRSRQVNRTGDERLRDSRGSTRLLLSLPANRDPYFFRSADEHLPDQPRSDYTVGIYKIFEHSVNNS